MVQVLVMKLAVLILSALMATAATHTHSARQLASELNADEIDVPAAVDQHRDLQACTLGTYTGCTTAGAAVATPGTSNHEAGKAVDVDATAYWRTTLAAYSFRWLGSGDPPHYDYTGSSSSLDVAREGLRAFQQLHNQNRSPSITADGLYGSQTASALYNAPCGGF
eukprot:8663-Heterococcus_DN1.PRE.2